MDDFSNTCTFGFRCLLFLFGKKFMPVFAIGDPGMDKSGIQSISTNIIYRIGFIYDSFEKPF